MTDNNDTTGTNNAVRWALSALALLGLVLVFLPKDGSDTPAANAAAATAPAASQAQAEPTSAYGPSDFGVNLVILSNECFDSAGALIEVQPELYMKSARPQPTQPLTIVYQIRGGGETQVQSIDYEGDGQYRSREHMVSTDNCVNTLTANVTNVLEG